MAIETIGLEVRATNGHGVLHQLTGVIARHHGDITSVAILGNDEEAHTYFEVALEGSSEALIADM
jgi:energy-converting hydrogenase B subunit Q